MNTTGKPKLFIGNMNFWYGPNAGNKTLSKNCIDSVECGEKTSTTRYLSDTHIEYWREAKVGDFILWKSRDKFLVCICTKPLELLSKDTTAEQWCETEGWGLNYFESKVGQWVRSGEAYQIHFHLAGMSFLRKVEEMYYTTKEDSRLTPNINDATKLEPYGFFKGYEERPVKFKSEFESQWDVIDNLERRYSFLGFREIMKPIFRYFPSF